MGSIQIVIKKFGKQFKQYPDKNDAELLTLQEYIDLSHYYVRTMAPSLYKQFKTSEDAQSYIAELLMIGDWGYNPDKDASRETWRINNAKKAIKELLRSSRRKKNLPLKPIDFDIDEIPNRNNNITDEENKRKAKFFINNSGLTQKEIRYVKNYYLKGMNTTEISKEDGVTPQDVSCALIKAMRKMRRCSRVL